MMSIARSRYPFTASQWQELEHQALIYKYMASGMTVPPDLLYTIRRSFDSSLSSKLLLNQPHHIGWNCFMGFGKKIDPEPGRCRRTDGKKWRCSKEAYTDSKYCERHMHRGRNRSRKPVEVMTVATTNTSSSRPTTTLTPTSSSGPPGVGFSSDQDHITKFHLDSSAFSRNNYGHGMKEEVDHEHVFFSSEASGTMRSTSSSSISTSADDIWQLAPLTMGSPVGHLKQNTYSVSQQHQQDQNHYYGLSNNNDVKISDMSMKIDTEDQQQPKKVMHHFFDEWPPNDNKEDTWLDSEDKFSGHGPLSKTHLSITIPNSSHDFFITNNEK